MRMSIYTKQIGNYLNNLVLAKTGTLIYENPLKGNSKKSHSSHKSEVAQISQITQRMPY